MSNNGKKQREKRRGNDRVDDGAALGRDTGLILEDAGMTRGGGCGRGGEKRSGWEGCMGLTSRGGGGNECCGNGSGKGGVSL